MLLISFQREFLVFSRAFTRYEYSFEQLKEDLADSMKGKILESEFPKTFNSENWRSYGNEMHVTTIRVGVANVFDINFLRDISQFRNSTKKGSEVFHHRDDLVQWMTRLEVVADAVAEVVEVIDLVAEAVAEATPEATPEATEVKKQRVE